MTIELDHLVVAGDTLENGMAHVERCLGAPCQPGGQHPRMGTHNALLKLGERSYIEVIAIDPDAPTIATPMATPRWFGLDEPDTRARLRECPRLLTWVARTDDLDATLTCTSHDAGRVRDMRRGDLNWRIAFAEDGRLIEQGLVPSLIEWDQSAAHPSTRLPDRGLELAVLHASHPQPTRVINLLDPIGLIDVLHIAPGEDVCLRAEITTRQGQRWLE